MNYTLDGTSVKSSFCVFIEGLFCSEQVMNDDKRKMAARAKDARDVESKRREHVERETGKNRVSSMNSALFFCNANP